MNTENELPASAQAGTGVCVKTRITGVEVFMLKPGSPFLCFRFADADGRIYEKKIRLGGEWLFNMVAPEVVVRDENLPMDFIKYHPDR